MTKVLAFDLDGTLSESDLFLLPAYRYALETLGAPVPDDAGLKNMIGGTYLDNWQISLPGSPEERYKKYCDLVLEFAIDHAPELGRAYTGLSETLELLSGRGYKLALCTNGEPDYADVVLRAIGLRKFFPEIPLYDSLWDKTRRLAHIVSSAGDCDAVMVGDRHFDRTAAKNNGIPFVGCGYGLFPSEVSEADALISTPSELTLAVERLWTR